VRFGNRKSIETYLFISNMKRIYFDNASTTPVDEEVISAMLPYFWLRFGNASSLHRSGLSAKSALDNSRECIARKINAKAEEIIFTSGGSESDNLAIKGIAYAYRHKGNHIITSSIEHPAVLDSCKALEEEGFKVTYLRVDNNGFVDIEQLESAITPKTILVSIIHANNEIGTIQDIERIGKLCTKYNLIFHVDAVQSFTKTHIDVKKMNIGLLSFSAHKIHGPKGIGGLYVNEGILVKKQIHGGHQEFDFRAGTENIAGIVGFAKAVELCEEEQNRNMQLLRDKLIYNILKNIAYCRLNGAVGDKRLCNNVNVTFEYLDGEALMMELDAKGVEVSTGSACSSQSRDPSHVLLAIGLNNDLARGAIRLTLNRYNNDEEIDYFLEILSQFVTDIRKINPGWNN
jgi:cysteine desulfurase